MLNSKTIVVESHSMPSKSNQNDLYHKNATNNEDKE